MQPTYTPSQLGSSWTPPTNIVRSQTPQRLAAPTQNTNDTAPVFMSDFSPAGFSAVDLNAFMHPIPGSGLGGPVQFGTLAMLSVSSHRDKFPVSALSRVGPRGFTYGHRTIAGTLAFNTLDSDAFIKALHDQQPVWSLSDLHPDELPPFDIQIVLVNDFGEISVTMLKSVTILDCGTTYSLDQVTLMETYSYMALDRTPLQPARLMGPKKTAPQITDEMAVAPVTTPGVAVGRPEIVEGTIYG